MAAAAGLLAQLGAAGVGVDLGEGVDSHSRSLADASPAGDRFGHSRMVVFEFTLADLARMRFAISPMWELVTSLRVLRNPQPAALHLPWVREAMPIAAGLDLALAFALAPPDGYLPDFLTPPPHGPVPALDDELDRMVATMLSLIHI